MQYRIDELSNLKNVRLYPKIFQLSSYLNSFDYLFMPSLHEGLALMPIEASFAKVPTIINRCPGLKDTLPEEKYQFIRNGYYVTDYNSKKDELIFNRIAELKSSFVVK